MRLKKISLDLTKSEYTMFTGLFEVEGGDLLYETVDNSSLAYVLFVLEEGKNSEEYKAISWYSNDLSVNQCLRFLDGIRERYLEIAGNPKKQELLFMVLDSETEKYKDLYGSLQNSFSHLFDQPITLIRFDSGSGVVFTVHREFPVYIGTELRIAYNKEEAQKYTLDKVIMQLFDETTKNHKLRGNSIQYPELREALKEMTYF